MEHPTAERIVDHRVACPPWRRLTGGFQASPSIGARIVGPSVSQIPAPIVAAEEDHLLWEPLVERLAQVAKVADRPAVTRSTASRIAILADGTHGSPLSMAAPPLARDQGPLPVSLSGAHAGPTLGGGRTKRADHGQSRTHRERVDSRLSEARRGVLNDRRGATCDLWIVSRCLGSDRTRESTTSVHTSGREACGRELPSLPSVYRGHNTRGQR
jgi:hypothetical protein